MMYLKELLFPSLCHRCLKREENFLCDSCMVGIELAEIKGYDTAHLFDAGADFLLAKRLKYQEIIFSFAIIQLQRLTWCFDSIESEPELIYLKKSLEKSFCMEGEKPLYLISRVNAPILLSPIKKDRYILII